MPKKPHPLTDEMIQEIGRSVGGCEFNDSCNDEMRATFDLAIRRSAEWMKENLGRGGYLIPVGWDGYSLDVDGVISDFRDEFHAIMNPLTKEDNNAG